jgi:hypothetical protein
VKLTILADTVEGRAELISPTSRVDDGAEYRCIVIGMLLMLLLLSVLKLLAPPGVYEDKFAVQAGLNEILKRGEIKIQSLNESAD